MPATFASESLLLPSRGPPSLSRIRFESVEDGWPPSFRLFFPSLSDAGGDLPLEEREAPREPPSRLRLHSFAPSPRLLLFDSRLPRSLPSLLRRARFLRPPGGEPECERDRPRRVSPRFLSGEPDLLEIKSPSPRPFPSLSQPSPFPSI
eukprot:CAMPEP_0113563548 /NCGR_PEP_ID=MMETSP0015_2-20120614/21130_1 /TAXON_ID=2838 /ORGANISM="Odontella" /LENGTH=148 /DNA_ID=CAMNT_0000465541 /DNA_START=259 /DNA_END=703 /DNA_ORIENTATION=+ /assembly_acc=CAM_ASM_000160